MKPLIYILLLSLVVLYPLGLVGQDKSLNKNSKLEAPFELSANLMVLDSNNQPVGGIRVEDVRLFEDNIEQKLTRFVIKKPGLDVVLVVDNTGSLRTQMKRVEEAAILLVVNLGAADEAQIIRFVDSDRIEIVEEWTSSKAKLIEAVKTKLYTEGGKSAVIDAVYLAVESLKTRNKPDRSQRTAIVLISDGEDRESFYDQKQLHEFLKGTNIQIFTIALTGQIPTNEYILPSADKKRTAENLAKNLGGTAGGNTYILEKVTDDSLMKVMQGVMIELRAQYLISYIPTNQKRNSTRKLRIEVADGPNGEKRRVFVRESYYVPKN